MFEAMVRALIHPQDLLDDELEKTHLSLVILIYRNDYSIFVRFVHTNKRTLFIKIRVLF
jgi:hypothetical protein